MSTKVVVQKELETMRSAIKREKATKANIFDCEAVLKHIQRMQTDGTPIGENSPYENFDEWKKAVLKEKEGYQSQIETIAKYKELVVAYEWYLEHNPAQ